LTEFVAMSHVLVMQLSEKYLKNGQLGGLRKVLVSILCKFRFCGKVLSF